MRRKAPNGKPWWHSKTLWINALAAGLVAMEMNTGLLQPYLPMNIYLALAIGLPVINSILRAFTTQGIHLDSNGESA